MAAQEKENKPALSAVDEDSKFERWLTAKVCTPVARMVPASIKPNTVSLFNLAVNWTGLLCAYWATWSDETWEEHESGRMGPGRDLSSARTWGLIFRLATAACTFTSLVLDCVDGMHARATGQCSSLGEVVDHAFDAANIPLIGSAFCLLMGVDKYTIAISMVACGLVFNSQLAVYRHKHRMVKPPTNGPESQMMVVLAEIFVSAVFFWFGRYHPWVHWTIGVVAVVTNIIQFNNFLYFWRHLDVNSFGDHARFLVLVVVPAVFYLAGAISKTTFLIASPLVAFRLSGAYVLYVVANKRRPESAGPLSSPFTSLHDGWDWPMVLYVLLLPLSPYNLASSTADVIVLVAGFVLVHGLMLIDAQHCLPVLVPGPPRSVISMLW